MKNTYLSLTIVGTVVPIVPCIEHCAAVGPSVGDLVRAHRDVARRRTLGATFE